MLRIPEDDVCWFCEYLAGRRPYTILHEDALTATLVTREQRGRPHLLVIPRSHRESVLDLTDDEAAALLCRVRDVARVIATVHDPEGIAVWQNNGVPAHQSVPHVHFHVAGTLPDGGTEWGPVRRLELTETDAIASALAPGGTQPLRGLTGR
jgi:histidine triad (HIT) family protein